MKSDLLAFTNPTRQRGELASIDRPSITTLGAAFCLRNQQEPVEMPVVVDQRQLTSLTRRVGVDVERQPSLSRHTSATSLSRAIAAVVLLLASAASCTSASAQATGEKLEDPSKPAAAAPVKPAPKSGAGKEYTFVDFIIVSGMEGYTIILLSFIMVGFMIEHALTIRKDVIVPEPVCHRLQELVAAGKLDEAIAYCQEPAAKSLVAECVLSGLERYKASQFGFAEYKAAVEEAGEEQTSQLYRKTEVLSVIGAIAPMLGLLGTVRGMILAFREIAVSEGAPKPADLADPIGLALVTTFEGLVVAIPAMIAYSFFRNLIDTLVSEAGKRVERILTPLNRPPAR